MGLLKLLTFPVSLPLSGGARVLRTVLSEAERRYYDESAILEEMAQLDRSREAGEIDAEMFDAREEALFERLLEARRFWQQRAEEGDA